MDGDFGVSLTPGAFHRIMVLTDPYVWSGVAVALAKMRLQMNAKSIIYNGVEVAADWPQIDRRQSIVNAYRLFNAVCPDAPVREVTARLVLKHWIVNFIKLLPPNVIESPGSWCVYVDASTGVAEWFETI